MQDKLCKFTELYVAAVHRMLITYDHVLYFVHLYANMAVFFIFLHIYVIFLYLSLPLGRSVHPSMRVYVHAWSNLLTQYLTNCL